ncbi:hypothetical protein NKI08_16080 [Mesorhizobium sp. M0768]
MSEATREGGPRLCCDAGKGSDGPGIARPLVDQAQSLRNAFVAQGAKPSPCSEWLMFDPGTQQEDQRAVEKAWGDNVVAAEIAFRFDLQKFQGKPQRLAGANLISGQMDQRRKQRNHRVWPDAVE